VEKRKRKTKKPPRLGDAQEEELRKRMKKNVGGDSNIARGTLAKEVANENWESIGGN